MWMPFVPGTPPDQPPPVHPTLGMLPPGILPSMPPPPKVKKAKKKKETSSEELQI